MAPRLVPAPISLAAPARLTGAQRAYTKDKWGDSSFLVRAFSRGSARVSAKRPAMKDVVDIFRRSQAYQGLRACVQEGRFAQAEGLWGSSSALALAALALDTGRWMLVAAASIDEAESLAADIHLFAPGLSWLFPPWETLPGDDAPPSAEVVSQRLALLRKLLFEPRRAPGVIVASVQSLLQPAPSPEALRERSLTVRRGERVGMERLADWLESQGFERAAQVELPGEFSRRGGILDVFPFSSSSPFRIEFFGDDVESIRVFDAETQISRKETDRLHLIALPRTEETKPHERRSLLQYLPDDAVVAWKEPHALRDRAERLAYGLEGLDAYMPFDALREDSRRLTRLELSNLPFEEETNTFRFEVDTAGDFGADPREAMVELRRVAAEYEHAFVLCNNAAERQRFNELREETDSERLAGVEARIGALTQGFRARDAGLAVIGYHEMFHRYRRLRPPRKAVETRALDTFLDLEPGDYVVHSVHGIARFLGMETLESEGRRREFMALEFAEGVKLYVPGSKVELVQKYVGGTDRPPALSRLGGRAWARRKARAQKAVEDLAAELLEIQKARSLEPGIAFPPDDEWQREFEAAFIYEETRDQLQVLEEIKQDMQAPRPMDRLVCGDVGYGKTELAMRAAFKAVMAGKQVAVLAPTTVLVQQHFRTFTERMADYPVNIHMLSRFRTKAQQRDTLEQLAAGRVDIVIGTHRLVQDDVAFKDLGLVIVDEEQRFGVEQKEKLKRLRRTVDVLTLTATPIPRTLHMALMGIRDISTLATPPQDRLAIQTRLWRFDPQKIREAILHELNRDGQVFFVHNRVHNIHRVADEVRRIVPEARVGVAHGQMPERRLERVMLDFVERKFDVLVCTTIIESGVDIPTVNTIFINRADHFGLADLHQLRGRVGRYKHRAYAYLLLPPGRAVNPDAEKRLKAILEFSELGAGFRIALRDMEIRGAGNILGAEQHGHIAAVGYDMYCRLLDAAVKRARGLDVPEPCDVALNLRLEAFLPDDYAPTVKQKIELYRRLSRCRSVKAIEAAVEEMRDRFGPLPEPAQGLVLENAIRILAQPLELRSISYTAKYYVLTAEDADAAARALRRVRGRVRRIDEQTLHLLHRRPRLSPTQAARDLQRILQRSA